MSLVKSGFSSVRESKTPLRNFAILTFYPFILKWNSSRMGPSVGLINLKKSSFHITYKSDCIRDVRIAQNRLWRRRRIQNTVRNCRYDGPIVNCAQAAGSEYRSQGKVARAWGGGKWDAREPESGTVGRPSSSVHRSSIKSSTVSGPPWLYSLDWQPVSNPPITEV